MGGFGFAGFFAYLCNKILKFIIMKKKNYYYLAQGKPGLQLVKSEKPLPQRKFYYTDSASDCDEGEIGYYVYFYRISNTVYDLIKRVVDKLPKVGLFGHIYVDLY